MVLVELKRRETGLHQIFTTTLGPGQVEWLSRGNNDLKSAVVSEIVGNCREILKGKGFDEIAKTEEGQPNVPGLKIVSFTLNPDTVKHINSISNNGQLNREEIKLVIGYVLRQAYLAARQSKPEVQREPLPQRTIFKDPSQIKALKHTPWQPRTKPTMGITVTLDRTQRDRSTWEPTQEDEAVLEAYGTLTRKQINFVRKWLKLSQEGFAKIVDVSRGIISDTENGRKVGEQTLGRISAGIWRHAKKQITPETQENPINELLEVLKKHGI